MKIPLVDLAGQHRRISGELSRALNEVIERAAFIGGPTLAAFERDLARSMEARFATGVASGTAALAIALRSLDLEPDDEVITTAFTAIPTAEAITLAGGRVVFADVEKGGFQVDPDQVSGRITGRTRAIVLVHLHGLAARIEPIAELARRRGLALVEDVAQAQGARFAGRRLGTFGLAGCLSFFPSKNLGGFGDGGAIVTDDPALARFAAMYSNHGRLEKFRHEIEGSNERLDALQAAVLHVKLPYLDAWNARRREVASGYTEDLSDVEEVRLPVPLEGSEPVWHLYVIRVRDRDALAQRLAADGIETGLHYPLPLHLQPAYAKLGHPVGSLPEAERAAAECLSLPMDPFLTREQVRHVSERIRFHLARS